MRNRDDRYWSLASVLPGILAGSLALAGAVVGCEQGGERPGSQAVEERAAPVLDGTIQHPWPSATTAYTRAIMLMPGCTGTLIAPSWVLSAKHCGFLSGETVTNVRPSGNVTRTIDRVIGHPRGLEDGVLVHLSSPITDVPPVPIYFGTTDGLANQSITCYGYGGDTLHGSCTVQSDCGAGQGCAGGHCISGTGDLRSATLPTQAVANQMTNPGVIETLKNAQGQVMLPGDSGGPCFFRGQLAATNGAWFFDLSGGLQTSVADFRSWMFATMQGQSLGAVCGRGSDGIDCAVSDGSSFVDAGLWAAGFSDANGWNADAKYYSTIQYADINGDGNLDVCGRASDGIRCAVSNGTSFTNYGLWSSGYSDANGWGTAQYYSTIQFADINGDGVADVCGRGSDGIDCAVSNGTSFTGYGQFGAGAAGFNDASGWNAVQYYSTIRLVDVNGDRIADVCGRGTGGIYCATSNGTSFNGYSVWASGFSDAAGWNSNPYYYSTIQFADINGDFRMDVCGRGSNGIDCALQKTDGTTGFINYGLWDGSFSDANGWSNGAYYYSTIKLTDVNGDGRADVCGRGFAGIYCSLSNGASGFTGFSLWAPGFNDTDGWSAVQYYSTIKFADVNGDGLPDVCGRGTGGMYCAVSNGASGFTGYGNWTVGYSDALGWNAANHYATIGVPTTVRLIP
jgi:hypothetical protein